MTVETVADLARAVLSPCPPRTAKGMPFTLERATIELNSLSTFVVLVYGWPVLGTVAFISIAVKRKSDLTSLDVNGTALFALSATTTATADSTWCVSTGGLPIASNERRRRVSCSAT